MIFYGRPRLWSAHGETVSRSVPYIQLWIQSLGVFRYSYVYGLCPMLFWHLLPQYWWNFYRFVAGICILQCPHISKDELLCGHDLLSYFAQEFEELYYQCKESQITLLELEPPPSPLWSSGALVDGVPCGGPSLYRLWGCTAPG